MIKKLRSYQQTSEDSKILRTKQLIMFTIIMVIHSDGTEDLSLHGKGKYTASKA
jgi:hypothetical protein